MLRMGEINVAIGSPHRVYVMVGIPSANRLVNDTGFVCELKLSFSAASGTRE